ncbi:MAG TPA: hypothetical protein VES68_01150 [Candidatus Sulfotelmatobacter sp.]|nr:hypothetical protein [Candidatus Sulfotelmatobacter sp.]
MKRGKRPISFLILSILSLGLLVYLVLNFSPSYNFPILGFNFPVLILFFLLFFIFLYSFFSFALINKRRGLFISLFVNIYLLLRLNGLTHIFFLILLVILFGCLELFFSNRS